MTGVGRWCHAEIIEQVDREDGATAWEANCGDGCKEEFEKNCHARYASRAFSSGCGVLAVIISAPSIRCVGESARDARLLRKLPLLLVGTTVVVVVIVVVVDQSHCSIDRIHMTVSLMRVMARAGKSVTAIMMRRPFLTAQSSRMPGTRGSAAGDRDETRRPTESVRVQRVSEWCSYSRYRGASPAIASLR